MSGSMMRNTLLTNNLANVDTPGYQPEDVNFQSTLQSAIQSGVADQSGLLPALHHAAGGRPRRQRRRRRAEPANLAQNGLLYETLIQVATQRESILKSAMGIGSLMSFFDAIDISASGLTAERTRMDVTAENLANAKTTQGANGQPYQRQEVVLQQAAAAAASTRALPSAMGRARWAAVRPGGVQVAGIVEDPTPEQEVYDPGNPDANAQGYVKMPNVNSVNEMVDMIDESRSYEANVTAMQTAKQMYAKTLELLK